MNALDRRRLDELAALLGLSVERFYLVDRWFYELTNGAGRPIVIGTGPAVLASLERQARALQVVR